MRRVLTLVPNLILLFSGVFFLAGGAALLVASGGRGWADLAAASHLMVADRGGVLVLLGALVAALTVAVLVMVWRSVAAARRPGHRAEGGGTGTTRARQEARARGLLLRRARRVLELEIRRADPVRVDRLMDTLLCLPGDIGAPQLRLEPGPARATVSLNLGVERQELTALPPELYEQVLERLRQMIGVAEATGAGVIDLRSSRGPSQLSIQLLSGADGVEARVEPILDEDASGPTRRRRARSVVYRHEPQPAYRDVATAELPVLPVAEHDGTELGAGVLTGLDPSGEHEVAPLVRPPRQRQVGRGELVLRLALGLLLTASAVVLFWHPFCWGLARVSGSGMAPWRDVTIQIASRPTGGEVVIAGKARGRTPLTVKEPCYDRSIAVLVRARGFTTWQWTGICPRARLRLSAELKPLE